MKLSNCRILGKYKNPETGRYVNVHKGRNMQRGTDILFFLRSGKRIYISDHEFYSKDKWQKQGELTLNDLKNGKEYDIFIFADILDDNTIYKVRGQCDFERSILGGLIKPVIKNMYINSFKCPSTIEKIPQGEYALSHKEATFKANEIKAKRIKELQKEIRDLSLPINYKEKMV